MCGEEFVGFEATSDVGTPRSIDIEKSICVVNTVARATELEVSNIGKDIMSESLTL